MLWKLNEISTKSKMNELILSLAQRTAQILKTKREDLDKIVWTIGESNPDNGFSKLACACCKVAWEQIQKEQPLYENTTLDLSTPDINLVFNHDGKDIHGKIELKSGLSEKIPGSTIRNLDINQATIFCLRPQESGEYKFRYGQYYSGMEKTPHDLFQDRTPRPLINFDNLSDPGTPIEYVNKEKEAWIYHYAECALRRVNNVLINLTSWQDALTSAIIDYFLKTTPLDQIMERRSKLLESAGPSLR